MRRINLRIFVAIIFLTSGFVLFDKSAMATCTQDSSPCIWRENGESCTLSNDDEKKWCMKGEGKCSGCSCYPDVSDSELDAMYKKCHPEEFASESESSATVKTTPISEKDVSLKAGASGKSASSAAIQSGGGIVPCGTDTPCTLCHLIIGIQKIVQFGLYLVTTMAFVGIFIGGAMYMISMGNSGMVESAKKFIGGSLIGFALVMGAWLIVNIVLNILPVRQGLGVEKTNWYTFNCDTTSTAGSGNATKKAENTSADTNAEKDKTDKKCGDENIGYCFKTEDKCPDGYRYLGGGNGCGSSSLRCCVNDGDLAGKNSANKDIIKCGENRKGTCFANTAGICPEGWIGYSGGASCVSGEGDGITKCCIEKGISTDYSDIPF